MSAPKIAALLAIAGTFGLIVSVVLGSLAGADFLLDASFVCLVLAGVIMMLHVMFGFWTHFTRSA
jgi:high-affinity Fe2+/Pb2+ permease